MNNINEFNDYISMMVADYDEDHYGDFNDYAHECADGSEYVIYYSKAWDLVNLVRENDYSLYCDSQPWAFDSGTEFESLEHIITIVACSIIHNAMMDAFNNQEQGGVA